MRRPFAPTAWPWLKARPRARRWLWHGVEFGLLIALLVAAYDISIFVWHLPNGDVDEYYRYALAFWTRQPLFHALPVEYPPLSIIPFTLAILPPLADYHAVYAWWMALLVLVGYGAFLRFSTRRRAITYAAYLLLGCAATVLARFDLVPGLLTLAALWATERRRFGYAYALLAAGILLKLYPGFLLPCVMIAHWQAICARDGCAPWRWEGGPRAWWQQLRAHPATRPVALGAALCLGLSALVFGCAMALAGQGALTGFSYAGDRPLQIESTPATFLWLGTLAGIPAHPIFTFVSLNYVGPLDTIFKPLSALALVVGCLWVYWRQMRGELSVGQAFVACLCAVIVTNKVFSPQYLIWVLPLVAAVDGFDILWVVVCILTTIDYPILYQARQPIEAVPESWQFLPDIALRNLVLLSITLRAILRPGPARPATRRATPLAPEHAPPMEHMERSAEDERGAEAALTR